MMSFEQSNREGWSAQGPQPKAATEAKTGTKNIQETAVADQLSCAKLLDWDAPVADVGSK